MMNKTYVPVACALYSRYELAILRGEALRVSWCAARGVHRVESLIPLDLRTRRHAEFMIARTLDGGRRVLRLDRIIRSEPIPQPDLDQSHR
jgi:Rho-binding antiterminator